MDAQGFISLNRVAICKWRSGCFSGSEVIWLFRKSHPGRGGAAICRPGGDNASPCISQDTNHPGAASDQGTAVRPPTQWAPLQAPAVRKQEADNESHAAICRGWLVTSQLGRGASGARRGPEGSKDSDNDRTFLCLSGSLSIHLRPKPN